MAASQSTSKANMAAARAQIAAQLGVDPDNLTYDQRVQYNKALAQFIADNPDQFTQGTVDAAKGVQKTNYQALQDPSFDWLQFGDELANNASSTLSSIGSFGKNLAVIAVLAALAFYILPAAIAKAHKG